MARRRAGVSALLYILSLDTPARLARPCSAGENTAALCRVMPGGVFSHIVVNRPDIIALTLGEVMTSGGVVNVW